jgi:dTDP-glucose 4,6-dehydratase
MNLLVCGGAGFIGSHFVRLALRELPEARVVVYDAFTYAGNPNNFHDFKDNPRFASVGGWIQDRSRVAEVVREEGITHMVNFAAESHNDRSLLEAGTFIDTNITGVHVLLSAVREFGIERFVQVSTDEVYGTTDHGQFTESSPIEPNTPYSAAKAGGDLQVRAAVKAFNTPALVTRGGNTYGPYHYPEKLIPFFVTRLIDGKKVPLYGEGLQVREWIHAEDHARGILEVLLSGEVGEVYNVGDENERTNIETVRILLDELGKGEDLIKRIPDPRGGAHDKRYSMSTEKIQKLGWSPQKPFERSLRETVRWYVDNEWWWRPITQDAAYQEFIRKFYGPTLGEDL